MIKRKLHVGRGASNQVDIKLYENNDKSIKTSFSI